MRIVSLLPSATEIITLLGLEEQLVGVSHECDYPESVLKLPHVTGSTIASGLTSKEIDDQVVQHLQSAKALYHLNMEILEKLQPDLIVTQALCDVCAVASDEVEAAACHLPGNPQIINLEPMSLQEVFDTIAHVAARTGCEDRTRATLDSLQTRVNCIRNEASRIPASSRPRVGFLEWIDPLFNAGHWTPELIEYAGGIDCIGSKFQPSRKISSEEFIAANPEVLVVAQCGFNEDRCALDLPTLWSIPGFENLPCAKNGHLYYTDGNAYFSRPGPRLVESLELMAHCLHPDRFEAPQGIDGFKVFCKP